jgi:hypothetical protein
MHAAATTRARDRDRSTADRASNPLINIIRVSGFGSQINCFTLSFGLAAPATAARRLTLHLLYQRTSGAAARASWRLVAQ